MSKRGKIAVGMVAGLIWAVVLLWVAERFVTLPVFTLMPTIMTAFLAPGIVLMAMIGRIAQRRFSDDGFIDGGALSGPAEIDRRVMQNTVEQLVLALAVWPAAAVLLAGAGPGVIVTLGIGFAVARMFFWVGYHISPPLRAFGFAATFYPTCLVAVWAVVKLVTIGG